MTADLVKPVFESSDNCSVSRRELRRFANSSECPTVPPQLKSAENFHFPETFEIPSLSKVQSFAYCCCCCKLSTFWESFVVGLSNGKIRSKTENFWKDNPTLDSSGYGPIDVLTFSSCGNWLSCASPQFKDEFGFQVVVWEFKGRRIRLETPTKARVRSLSFSQQNSFLAAGDEQGYLHVWSTTTWKQAAPICDLYALCHAVCHTSTTDRSLSTISFVKHGVLEYLVAHVQNVYIFKSNLGYTPNARMDDAPFEFHQALRANLQYNPRNVRTVMCVSKCGKYLAIAYDTSQTPGRTNILWPANTLDVYQFSETTREFERKIYTLGFGLATDMKCVQHLHFGGPGSKFLVASSTDTDYAPVVVWNIEDQTKITIPIRTQRDTDCLGSCFGGFDDRYVMTVLFCNFEKSKRSFVLKHDISWLYKTAELTKWVADYLQFVRGYPSEVCGVIISFAGLTLDDFTRPPMVRTLLVELIALFISAKYNLIL